MTFIDFLDLIIFRRRQQQQQNLPAQPNNQNGQGNGAESPDMDFLEMDFDPGDEDSDSNESDEADPKTQELLSTGTPEALAPIGNTIEPFFDFNEITNYFNVLQKLNL